jgi:hypothetical protein
MAVRKSKSELVPFPQHERVDTARIGRVIGCENREFRVEFAGGPPGGIRARASVALDDHAFAEAARERREALLLFENGDPSLPVVVMLLRSRPSPVERVLVGHLADVGKVARVDDRHLVIEGKEEVVIRCGKAALTLRRDGTIVLRGVNVVSQAEQVYKVRGGKVQIN